MADARARLHRESHPPGRHGQTQRYEGRVDQVFQVGPVFVVMGKTPVEVLGRWRTSSPRAARPAPPHGAPDARGHWRRARSSDLPGLKPPLLPALRHPHDAPTTPGRSGAAGSACDGGSALPSPQNGRQVRDAGEGHQPRYPEQTPLLHHSSLTRGAIWAPPLAYTAETVLCLPARLWRGVGFPLGHPLP